jgi:hypothetical protein
LPHNVRSGCIVHRKRSFKTIPSADLVNIPNHGIVLHRDPRRDPVSLEHRQTRGPCTTVTFDRPSSSAHQSVRPSVHKSGQKSVHKSDRKFVRPSVRRPVPRSVRNSAHKLVCPPAWPSVHLYVCQRGDCNEDREPRRSETAAPQTALDASARPAGWLRRPEPWVRSLRYCRQFGC